MNGPPKIAILLSTYNGAEYLAEQFQSILDQTYTEYLVIARDDGSQDGTHQLLQEFAQQNPGRMHLVQDLHGNLGASGSFAFLMGYALERQGELGLEPAYFTYCDQDDHWLPEKLQTQMRSMMAMETEIGSNSVPLLVHSDLRVVSEQGEIIADSFVRYQGLEINRNRFNHLLISNLVTGCTALFNGAAARKALPIPRASIMHDWWLALVVSAFGRVTFLPQQLVHYRQHGNNTIGAKEFVRLVPGEGGFLRRLLEMRSNEHLQDVARQAVAFRERFESELDPGVIKCLRLASGMAANLYPVQRLYYRRARRL